MAAKKYSFRLLRLMRATLITVLLAVIPAVLIVWTYAPDSVMLVLAVGAGLLLAVRVGFHVWPCPRCGKPFCRGSAWGGQNMFARQCVHCGLREHEIDEEIHLNLSGKPE